MSINFNVNSVIVTLSFFIEIITKKVLVCTIKWVGFLFAHFWFYIDIYKYKGDVLPIEVKSGKDYKKYSALDNLLDNENYDIT